MTTPVVPPPVHLPHHKLAVRDSYTKRAMPFSEPGAPRVSGITAEVRCAELLHVVEYLDVENSARYKRTPSSTWCNIYAGDAAFLGGVYLPHVYWTDKALSAFASSVVPLVRYGDTVTELSANGLDAWMRAHGHLYGWQRVHQAGRAQELVNGGSFGICLARKAGGIGHVSVIVPESPAQSALRDATGVVAPAQSQAGARNRQYFATRWWTNPGYNGGLWVVPWVEPGELLARAAKTATDLIG